MWFKCSVWTSTLSVSLLYSASGSSVTCCPIDGKSVDDELTQTVWSLMCSHVTVQDTFASSWDNELLYCVYAFYQFNSQGKISATESHVAREREQCLLVRDLMWEKNHDLHRQPIANTDFYETIKCILLLMVNYTTIFMCCYVFVLISLCLYTKVFL